MRKIDITDNKTMAIVTLMVCVLAVSIVIGYTNYDRNKATIATVNPPSVANDITEKTTPNKVDNLPPQLETQQMSDQLKDLTYKIESGISANQLSHEKQFLWVSMRKYQDKYPGNPFTLKIIKINGIISDMYEIWSGCIEFGYRRIPLTEGKWIKDFIEKNYPQFTPNIKSDIAGYWDRDKLLSSFVGLIQHDISELNYEIKSSYSK